MGHPRSQTFRIRSFLAPILVVVLAACSTSPTGRNRLQFLPDSMMNSQGAQAFQDLKSQTPVDHDPATNAYVKCVANAIVGSTQGKDTAGVKNWEIVVFDSKEVNAFALPGGKIGVYTGILPVANTQDQLATVLGHEVGHVLARHGSERASDQLVTQLGLTGLEAILAGKSGKLSRSQQLIMVGAMGVAQFGVILPFSRDDESEADHIGLQLMADAGFDPTQAVTLWQNMSKAGGGQPPEFASTHPSNSRRIDQIRSWEADAEEHAAKAHAAGRNPQCRR
ncbi:MAG TPA: M48 family metallopeptidase [Bdellovibrionota bacterium]|jgi:predicted Zn-dependent protease|nr:M48 family metallopeptidase [Bdellovibrionota bacterium]